ncbi:MAG TPA: Fe-S cluster assembly protein SufD [Gemmatimonadaceae bacterium]|nr:Fe-S cluster assembly protein SufD [Gemmatimonadaceae bacterium]
MIESYLRAFERTSTPDESNAPDWARSLRLSAITRFETLGFPTTKNEDWHFTSVAPIAEREFDLLAPPKHGVKAAQLVPFTFGARDWHTLVFVNGRYDAALSSAAGLPEGVTLVPLKQAYETVPLLVEQYLGKVAAFEGETFTALNTAFLDDGAVVHVGREVEVARPIHLLFVSDASAGTGTAQPHNLIVLDRFAKATVIESYAGLGGGAYFTNVVTEAVVGDGATLTHLKLQRESEKSYHVGTLDVRQARDSHLVSFSFAAGAALSRTNIYTELRGEGCGATLNGLYLGDGEQHLDHQTRIEHVEPNCYSREHYKGILDGSAHGVFNGKVYVHPAAQKTDGKQTNNTLLLSEKAQIDTKPQLEIFADDVKCTHGATVGRLDETALFYLKSRGIAARTARQLLTYAFAADVLESIELEPVRDGLEAATLRRYIEQD